MGSELDDPDLVENNLAEIREADAPMIMKYLIVLGAILSWKWFYYAPNTYKELKLAQCRRQGTPIPKGVDPRDAVTIRSIFAGTNPFYSVSELFTKVLGPYLIIHFFLLPLPYLFLAVVTNHAGDDMYRFNKSCRPFSGSFYLRQV